SAPCSLFNVSDVAFQFCWLQFVRVVLFRITRNLRQQLVLATQSQTYGVTNARFYGEDLLPNWVCQLYEARNFGSRTDQRHITTQHIPKCRQFVELRVTEEPAQARDAGITVAGDLRPISGRRHCTKFVELKSIAVLSDSF